MFMFQAPPKAVAKKAVTPAKPAPKAAKNGKAAKKAESEEDDDSGKNLVIFCT